MPLLPADTLAYHQLRALQTHVDWSGQKCSVVAAKIKKFMAEDENEDAQPETLALDFYGLNHAMAIIAQKFDPLEPLPAPVLKIVEAYYRINTPHAIRCAYYLLWICIREARHGTQNPTAVAEMTQKFGSKIIQFMSNIHGGEAGISQKFVDNPPDMNIGPFVEAIEWQFTKFGYSSSFGGIKWQIVNNCLTRMVKGEFSPEMMLDVVWTLAHNGGPIFNKGEMFGHYTQEIYELLDVQRSGQIPEYVLTGQTAHASAELKELMLATKELFPGEIGEYVDWYKVEGLGALKKYDSKKKAQVEAFGMSEWAAKFEAEKIAKEKEKLLAEKLAKEKFDKEYLVIMPGVSVKKVERPKAA